MVVCPSCEKAIKAKDAIDAWNALPRAPQWTMYDGMEETLPEDGTQGALLLSRNEPETGLRIKDVVWKTASGWLNDRCQERPYTIGDRWMYWLEEDDNDA
jgi:hypothetical protein